jgi:hypothetical protein
MPTASIKGDRPSQSKLRNTVDHPPAQTLPTQRLLTMAKQPVQEIDHALVRRQPSMLAAVKLCISMGGLEADKEVYMPLGIDAGHWTRIMRGEAHFPIDRLPDLMDLCGNEAPMLWLLDNRGYDLNSLRHKETETARQLREAHEHIARMEAERHAERILISDLLTGRVHEARGEAR